MASWVEHRKTAGRLFTDTIAAVTPEQWHWPTPCAAWDVRALVEHAVDYQRGYGRALGADAAVETELGSDPAAAWGAINRAFIAALDIPGALDRSFDFLTPLLPGTVAEQMVVPALDLLIHSWDLARAVGADESLPADLCDAVLAAMQPVEESIRIPEWYGPAIEPPAGADVQTRLLCFTGRAV